MPAVPSHSAQCLGCTGISERPFGCLADLVACLARTAVCIACSARACSSAAAALAADLTAVSAARSAARCVQLAESGAERRLLLSGAAAGALGERAGRLQTQFEGVQQSP